MSIIWTDAPDHTHAKPHQYFYQGEPCEVLSLGVNISSKKVCTIRLKLADGSTMDLGVDNGGKFPGLAYELGGYA